MLACVFASDGVYAGAVASRSGRGRGGRPAISAPPAAAPPYSRERERGSAGQRIRQGAAERDVSDRLRQRAECDGAEEGARPHARQAGRVVDQPGRGRGREPAGEHRAEPVRRQPRLPARFRAGPAGWRMASEPSRRAAVRHRAAPRTAAASASAVPATAPKSTPAATALTCPGNSARQSMPAVSTNTTGPAGPAAAIHRCASLGPIPARLTATNAAAIASPRPARRAAARRRSASTPA